SWTGFMRFEQSHRMSAHHDQCMMMSQLLQIFLNQLILHPILAYLSGLSISNQFIRIKGYFMIQIIIDHYLEGFSLNTFSLIFINRFSINPLLRHETVSVNAASCQKLI